MSFIADSLPSRFYSQLKMTIFCICLFVGSVAFANPEIPNMKIVHVGKYQAKDLKIPDESRFKNINGSYLEFSSDFSDAYWIKPILTNDKKILTGHLFTFIPKSLDTIKMYVPALNGDQPIIDSNRFDVNTNKKYSHRARVFELPDNYKQGQNIYFYVAARNSTQLKIEYWNQDDYFIVDRQDSSIYSAVFASLFILVLINFIFYLAFKENNYLRYVFYLCAFLIFIMTSSGKIYEFNIAKYIAANYNHNTRFFALAGLSLVLFVQGFLNLRHSAPIFYRFTQILFTLYAIVLVAAFVIWPIPYISLSILNMATLIAMPVTLYVAVSLWIKDNKQAKYFVLAFAPLFVMISLRIFVVIDIIPPWKFALSGFQVAIVFQALVLSLGLADRILSLQKQRDEAHDLSKNVSSLLKSDKDFSMFLARISADVRANPNETHDDYILNSFFSRLSNLFSIKQGAIVSQINSQLVVKAVDSVTRTGFEDYVNDNLKEIARICTHVDVVELTIQKHPFFSRFSKMLLLPVHMRGHEWSCMILNIDLTQRFSEIQLDSLQRYSTELIRTLVNAEKMKHFSIKAETDYLTQVFNRGAILTALEDEMEKVNTNNLPLSIAFIDIDHFKNINDNLGHEAGDTCLSYLALQIRRYLPEGSYVGRMGGDEFLFVLPNHSSEQARACLNSLMNSLETLIIDDVECSFTLSIGIAQHKSGEMDLKNFLRAADETLYQSKENGRNQITTAA